MKYIYIIFICILNADISEGYTLFSPISHQSQSGIYYTYLINENEESINVWSHNCKPLSISYLLPDSSIIIPCNQSEVPGLGTGSSGGRILKLSWSGEILWDDIFVEDNYQPHHDIEPMSNGNVLFIAYERKSYEDGIQAGREYIDDEIWPSMIFELQQVSIDSGIIV